MNNLLKAMQVVIFLFTAVIWSVVGLVFWIPLLLRAVAVFSTLILHASLTGQDANALGGYLDKVLRFYADGFRKIYDTLFTASAREGRFLPRIHVTQLLLEILWAGICWITFLIGLGYDEWIPEPYHTLKGYVAPQTLVSRPYSQDPAQAYSRLLEESLSSGTAFEVKRALDRLGLYADEESLPIIVTTLRAYYSSPDTTAPGEGPDTTAPEEGKGVEYDIASSALAILENLRSRESCEVLYEISVRSAGFLERANQAIGNFCEDVVRPGITLSNEGEAVGEPIAPKSETSESERPTPEGGPPNHETTTPRSRGTTKTRKPTAVSPKPERSLRLDAIEGRLISRFKASTQEIRRLLPDGPWLSGSEDLYLVDVNGDQEKEILISKGGRVEDEGTGSVILSKDNGTYGVLERPDCGISEIRDLTGDGTFDVVCGCQSGERQFWSVLYVCRGPVCSSNDFGTFITDLFDFEQDGRIELALFASPDDFLERYGDDLYNPSLTMFGAFWAEFLPQLVKWNGAEYVDASREYPEYYRRRLPDIRERMAAVEANHSLSARARSGYLRSYRVILAYAEELANGIS